MIQTNFNLPVTVATGHLQKLSLHIPWNHLYSHSTEVVIDGLYLLLTPRIDVNYDPEQDAQKQYAEKMKEVHKVEQFRKEREVYENSKTVSKNKDTFLERLQIHILRNLTLSISNIHITYEDKTTKPDHPFSFGITLNYIKLYTTNDEWTPVVSKDESPIMYKLGELNALSIYWNSNVKSQSELSQENIIDKLQAKFVSKEDTTLEPITYILRPLNVNVKLKMAATSHEQDYTRPIFDAKIDIDYISLNINRNQYCDLLDLLEFQNHLKLESKYIKYYSMIENNTTDKLSVRRWKFAYVTILNEEVRPRLASYKWETIKTNLERFREYREVYFQVLSGNANNKQKQRAEELERTIDVFNLLFIRRTVEIEIKKKQAEQKEQGWWENLTINSWWSGESNEDNPEFNIDNATIADEKKKLYDAIGYAEDDTSSVYPEEYVDIDLSIRLNMLEINVWSNIKENDTHLKIIACAVVPNVGLIFKRRPVKSDFLFVIDLNSFDIFGVTADIIEIEESNGNRPVLVKPVNQIELKQKSLLHIEYETNPLDRSSENRIQIILQSLEITYDAFTINKLIEYFQPDRKRDLQGIKEIAYSTFNDIKYRTHFLFNHYLKNIQASDINIDLQPFYFLLPENGIYRCWKIDIQISAIDGRLSDKHIFEIIKLFQSISFPESKEEPVETEIRLESTTFEVTVPRRDTKKTLEAVESMTPVQKILQEAASAEAEDKTHEQVPAEIVKKKVDLEDQIIELEVTFELPQIDLLIEESLSNSSNDTQPFIRISLLSIIARTTMKTFDINFNASLADFIIIHEQFITNNNDRLCLIAMERLSDRENDTLISINGFLTSPVNPNFASAPYNSIENQIHVHIGKPILMLQLEAVLSIIRFQNDIMKKISKDKKETKRQTVSKENPKHIVKKDPASGMSTFQFEVHLEGLRAIIGLEFFQIIDIQSQGLHAHILNSIEKTSAHLILTDLRVFDANPNARYRHIISQQTNDKQLLYIDFTLFNYPKKYEKTIDDIDCDIKIQLTKLNIVLLYKHIDLILNLINLFQIKKTKSNVSSNEPSAISETMEKFQNQARKLRLDVILNAPSIFVPTSSYSNEGLFIDFGQLTAQTHFNNDPNRLYVEQQVIIIKNLFASRVQLDKNNETRGDISLLKCTELSTLIDRLLYPEKIQNEPEISIITKWDTIEFTLGKDDYACIMKIFKANFSEKIYHKIPKSTIIQEKVEYRQKSVTVTNKNQQNLSDNQVSKKIHFNAEIKKIALTLYLSESKLITRYVSRDENLKFLDLRFEMFKADFCQLSDSSYNGKAQIQTFLLDDLRETNKSNTVTHMIDRNFNVDPNVPMFTVTLEFKKENKQQSNGVREVNAELESFYICMSPDYFMALYNFFILSLSLSDEKKSYPSIMYTDTSPDMPLPAKPISTFRRSNRLFSDASESPLHSPKRSFDTSPTSEIDDYLHTKVNIVIKSPEIILLEDQHNQNSNCLVLDFASQIRMDIVGNNTKIYGSLKDLTIYGSNFAELKTLKVKYRILQPVDIDGILIMNSKEQKIDLCIGDITIQIPPAAIRTVLNLIKSMGKLETPVRNETEKINSKGIFDTKPFKDASFWFIKDNEEKQELIEQTDILELTTGTPSHKKASIEEANKHKEKEEKIQNQNILFQQLNLNLKIIEIKLELGTGSFTKPVIAMCLSNLFVDVKNWSSNMSISSKIHVELALFNDNLLSWEPLIEPVINDRGEVVCPWCITCSTSNHEEDEENDDESRFLLDDPKSSSNTEPVQKDDAVSLDAKQVIYVRADHLLNITITKTMLNLAQRLSTMFKNAYNTESSWNEDNDDDDDRSMLSIHNMTGYDIYIDNLKGVKFLEDKKLNTPIHLKQYDSLPLTVPSERLSATRIPAIAEQMSNRRQEFSVQIANEVKTVDINQTWRRVFDLGPSSIPDWPIQLLCDSQLYNDRRRIVLSSIIKVFNRATMPVMILDIDSVEMGTYREVARIEPNGELYLPLELVYAHMNSHLFITIEEAKSTNGIQDFISFDWAIESSTDRVLNMKNGKDANLVFYKESKDAYSENTDEPIRTSFHVYVKLALHLINLLSLDVECSIDIPCYNDAKWISESIDLTIKSNNNHNDHPIIFHNATTQETLRLLLRVDTYRASYRASLYSPYWIVNCTDMKFEFKVEGEKTLIEIVDPPFFVCPINFDSKKKKGQIRIFNKEQDDAMSEWSEDFSLDVIKSTGMASCKIANDRTYMICIDIVTSSFGMTKIVTLAPATVVINRSTIEIEVTEAQTEIEEEQWRLVKPEDIIPFWPRNVEEAIMRVRYTHNRISSTTFSFTQKHRTLLRMNDEERPALQVEVIATDFDGFRVVFGDYKIGDAPILLVNCLKSLPIAFCQTNDVRTQILPPLHYIYYTWINPLKLRTLFIGCHDQSVSIELNPLCGVLEANDQQQVYYTVFQDGPQTVLLFTEETDLIEAVTYMPSLGESMKQHLQIGIRDIGIAIIDDIVRNDLFYISISKSKDIWMESSKSRMRPLSYDLNKYVDEQYESYIKDVNAHSNDEEFLNKKYRIDENRDVSFDEDTAELTDHQDHLVRIKRQPLDGLWVGFAWSASNAAIHLRINRIQIDNEHEFTLFPVVLNPIVSKAAGTDIPGKPFIEFSLFKTTIARSNTIHIKYLKLLVQEFVFCADQTLIMSILTFLKSEKITAAPTINMDSDLKRIHKPLKAITEAQSNSLPAEPKIYFDNMHLSPLKIHVSFSMHGTGKNEQLLAEYPLVDFLLQILNVAEVQDVILKINCYERKNDQFTTAKVIEEIENHYQNQLMRQLHVVVLGLDVLGNPFGLIRGVAEGVESFFYEPYKASL
ncbi:unnamed protein product [Rotaria sordida]|uniref:Vacuolar protein sorting-associated protein n=1 Tax=Rotaria sordida TaxID=392033 RepID=A0A814U3X9_9BILA|nr:unnamed protein product [Rotaria sordida]